MPFTLDWHAVSGILPEKDAQPLRDRPYNLPMGDRIGDLGIVELEVQQVGHPFEMYQPPLVIWVPVSQSSYSLVVPLRCTTALQ